MHEHKNAFKIELLFIAASAVLLAAAMLITGKFSGMKDGVKLAIFLVPYLAAGAGILLEAGEKLVHGELLDEDFLMSIASIGALCIGEYPEAVAVMLFYRIGELLEHRATAKSRRSVTELMRIRPKYACVEVDGKLLRVELEKVHIGTVITVGPGEKIPLDGFVVEGSSTVDTSALTGESMPRPVTAGQPVTSGCINLNGVIKVRVTSKYADSTVAKILELVEKSAKSKSKREGLITRFAKIYTPIVVALALLIGIVPPLIVGDWAEWIRRSLIFLVVSCPCALVISVPLSFFCGIGGASRQGILIKGADCMETLSETGLVLLDKTGTVTEGSFRVSEYYPVGISSADLVTLAAGAESYSSHPIAAALRRACFDMPEPSEVSQVREIPGRGVSATVRGRKVLVGSASLMTKNGIQPASYDGSSTVVHVAADKLYLGYIVIDDRIKSGAHEAVAQLRELGIEKIDLLTGDSEEMGNAVGVALGLNEVLAGLLPGDKVTALEEFERIGHKGKLLFAGDGVNDAPVLARADIGVAMGVLGSDAAIEAADVVLMDDDITKLPLAIRTAKRTVKIAKQNIRFSLAVKFAIMLLGAFGIANMWMAVFADVGVLLLAVLNATRTLKIKAK